MQVRRVDHIALLKADVIGGVVDRVRCLIAKLAPADLDAALDKVLTMGFPQPDVRQELTRLIGGVIDVADVIEAVYPLGQSAGEYLWSPV
jgi:hypothetical protein